MHVFLLGSPGPHSANLQQVIQGVPGAEVFRDPHGSLYAFALIHALGPDAVVVDADADDLFPPDPGLFRDKVVFVPIVVLVGRQDRIVAWRRLFRTDALHCLEPGGGLASALTTIFATASLSHERTVVVDSPYRAG